MCMVIQSKVYETRGICEGKPEVYGLWHGKWNMLPQVDIYLMDNLSKVTGMVPT